MSSEFTGVTFPEQKVTPSDDAVIRRALLPDCALDGCAFSYSGSTLTMAAGMLMICGRQIRHPSTQNWAVVDATSGFARLVLTIDLTLPATKDVFEQVVPSIEYATARDGFADLIRDDINAAGTRYQLEACVVSLGTGGITGIVSTLQNLNGQFPYASADAERRLKLAAPVNLLDNSDFRNPVNTNGQKTYTGACFTIDKWRTWTDASEVTVNDGYVYHSDALYQNANMDVDKVYTLAAKNTNGEIFLVAGKPQDHAYAHGLNIEPGEGAPYVRIWAEEQIRNLVWLALYEGEYTLETLPEYQPKGYNVELLNCDGYARNAEYTATIPVSAWADYGSAKQCSVSVGGILATDSPIIDVQLTGTTGSVDSDLLLDEEWGKIYRASAYDGGITIIAREAPTVALPIKIKVVR